MVNRYSRNPASGSKSSRTSSRSARSPDTRTRFSWLPQARELWHSSCCLLSREGLSELPFGWRSEPFSMRCHKHMKRAFRFAGFAAALLLLSAAAHAGDRDEATGATGVTLYEVSERVTFDEVEGVVVRNATSPLQGFAALGTPLCPSQLLISVPKIDSCTVIATGTDSVSTQTGLGPVSGTFDVVINAPGNSSVHVPDLPVISGTFSGTVDLSPAVVNRLPLGSIEGTFTIAQVADPATGMLMDLPQPVVLPFKGIFRMPFKLGAQGRFEWSQRGQTASYLHDDLRNVMPVRAFERSTGFPNVRLEVSFGP